MLTKAQINHLKSLKLKKYRQNYDEFIIEGDKLITEALLGNVELRRLVATNQWLASNKIQLPQHLVVETVTEKEMQQISSLTTSPDVLGVMKKMQFDIQSFTPENNWALILDGISDPGNFGTIIRTAEWFGIETIICSVDTVELYNPKVVQSSMGSLFRTKVYYTDLPAFLAQYPNLAIATTLKGQNIYSCNFKKSGFLVIGSESHGIGDNVLKLCSMEVKIPAIGKAESLNAAVATGIALSVIKGR